MVKNIIKDYNDFCDNNSYDCLLTLNTLQAYVGYFDNAVRSYFTTIETKPLSHKDFLHYGLFVCIKWHKIF